MSHRVQRPTRTKSVAICQLFDISSQKLYGTYLKVSTLLCNNFVWVCLGLLGLFGFVWVILFVQLEFNMMKKFAEKNSGKFDFFAKIFMKFLIFEIIKQKFKGVFSR